MSARRAWFRGLLLSILAFGSSALPAGAARDTGTLRDQALITADGTELHLHSWMPADAPKAVILALHGFNDHGGAFGAVSDSLGESGFLLYAYDQRGFGRSGEPGRWAGHEVLAADARLAVGLLRERHAGLPIYLMGKSMGGAVALLAMAHDDAPAVDGVVLLAPAVVGEAVMPAHQRMALWVAERLLPWMPLSVELGQALGYSPTDLPEVTAGLRADPLVIDYPRVSAVAGLAELMGAALAAAPRVPGDVLMLYGMRDDLVPVPAICALLDGVQSAASAGNWSVRIYPDGFHMLTRYSGAASTRADLLHWLNGSPADPAFEDPSGGREALGCER